MNPTRSVALYLTPAEAAALYETSRFLDWNKIAGGDQGPLRAFWRSEDWISARVQLERTLRGENEFTDQIQKAASS